MSFIDAFRFRTVNYSLQSAIPEIFPFSIACDYFVKHDLINIYSKILIDCTERSEGINEKVMPAYWDNCLESESNRGLISLLACAMTEKSELYLVYKNAVLRVATMQEQQQIKADYTLRGTSNIGIYASFKHFVLTDMLRIYSRMEYSVLNSLNKSLNVSAALQFKMSKLRETVGAVDSGAIIEQARSIAVALGKGSDVLMDLEDNILSAKPEMDSTAQAIEFLDAKRCFYLNLPLSYVTGEQTGGIGSTGEADMRAVERGLKRYWISILKPVSEALFGIKLTFKSNDFRQITSALEAVKTFELIGEDLVSQEDKKLIVGRLFDLETK